MSTSKPSAEAGIVAGRSVWTGWYAVIVLCVALLLSFTDRFIINLIVDPIRADLGLSDLQISFIQGIGFALIYALAGLPSGRLADFVNRRNLIAGGIVLWSVATIFCGLASDFWSLFSARLAVGLGEAALVPAASSLIIELFSPQRRGLALGAFSLGAVFGTGVALYVGGVVLSLIDDGQLRGVPWISDIAPWRQLLILAGLPGFPLVGLIMLITDTARSHVSALLPLTSVFKIFTAHGGAVLRVCSVKAVLSIGDNALIAWLPTLLQRSYNMAAAEAGAILALSITTSGAVASLAGGAASDFVVRRWGVRTRVSMLLGCYALAAVSAISMFFIGSGSQIAIAFAIWALGSISGYVVGHIVMQEWVPSEMRATTIALSLTMTAFIGIGLGPTLVPLAARYAFGGEDALQPAMASVSTAAALLALFVVWPVVQTGHRELTSPRR